MGIGDIRGGYRRLQEDLGTGDEAKRSDEISRSTTSQKVRQATTSVIGGLKEIGILSKKMSGEIGKKLGQLSSANLAHPSIVSLQKSLGRVHRSVSDSLNKVFQFLESHLQVHAKGMKGDGGDGQTAQNLSDFRSWLSKAKAENGEIDRGKFVGLEGLTQQEARLRKPTMPQLRESIEGRIADLSGKLTHLEGELAKAVKSPMAFTSSLQSGKTPDKIIEAKSYQTLPNTNRNLDKELKVLQNAIKSSKRELAAFDVHTAKLLSGAVKKAANAEKSSKAALKRDETDQARSAIGEKNAAKVTAGAEKKKEILQQRREKMKAYGAKVRERSETATGQVPTARRTLRRAEQDLKVHQESLKQIKDTLFDQLSGALGAKAFAAKPSVAQLLQRERGDRLADRVEDKKQMLNMIQGSTRSDFGKDQTIDALQHPREIKEISDRVVDALSDDQIALLIQEGQEAAKRAEISYPQELTPQQFATRKASSKITEGLFKPVDGLYDKQIVRDLVKSAMAKAIIDDEQQLIVRDLVKSAMAKAVENDQGQTDRVNSQSSTANDLGQTLKSQDTAELVKDMSEAAAEPLSNQEILSKSKGVPIDPLLQHQKSEEGLIKAIHANSSTEAAISKSEDRAGQVIDSLLDKMVENLAIESFQL